MDSSNKIGVLVAVVLLFTVILSPILTFGLGYISGLILKWAFGASLVNGLNLIFNTERFTPDMLPLICGGLAVIGGFFRSSSTEIPELKGN